MPLTPEESRRLHVLSLLERGRLTPTQAAEALGLTPRQVRRLRATLRRDGPAGLAHGNRGVTSPRRLPEELRARIVALAQGRYAGLNDHHLTEKLTAIEGLTISRATVRRILRAAGLGSPRHRRPPQHRSRRPRQPQAGLLLQLDGSPYAWVGPPHPTWSLLGAVDDATGAVLAAIFRLQEDAAGYLTLLRRLGETVGLPAAVYTDGHGIFVRNDPHWTRAEELQGYQDPTQVGRAFRALGIRHLVAHSPQAKGRIERLWETLQDRLAAELRLAGITTLPAANAFLAAFLPAFNAQFAVPAAVAVTAYRPVPRGLDLTRCCAFHYSRQVAADNTVRVDDVVLQLLPGPRRRSYTRATADVVQCLDGSWRVYVADRLLATTPAPSDPGQLRARRRGRSVQGGRPADIFTDPLGGHFH